MYEHSPAAYDLIHAARGDDYEAQATELLDRIRRHRPDVRSVLDVACGTGLHLAAFARLGLEVGGVDLSAGMLAAARQRVPDVPLHQGDMRTFSLDRRFDAVVCMFSSIGYMTTLDDLATALATMRAHLVDGGVLLVEPWFGPDEWYEGTVHADCAKAGGSAVGRVSRSWREGSQSVIEMHYVLARPDRTWEFRELHRMGLFTTAEQLDVFRAAGFAVEHEEHGLRGRGLFVAVSPPSGGPPA